jgi:ABC-2 type transport system permease protein
MRALLMQHEFRTDLMLDALAINTALIIASFATFLLFLRSARRHGSLLQGSE